MGCHQDLIGGDKKSTPIKNGYAMSKNREGPDSIKKADKIAASLEIQRRQRNLPFLELPQSGNLQKRNSARHKGTRCFTVAHGYRTYPVPLPSYLENDTRTKTTV